MTTRKQSSARAIADVTNGTILAAVEIAAPPERVFRLLTSPEEILHWWGSDELYKITQWTADFRTGGAWRAEGRADGSQFVIEGKYLEIDPPRKLAQTWTPDFDQGHVTRLTYVLESIETGTRVTLRHDGFDNRAESCRNHTLGWERVLNWLEAFAAPPTAAARDNDKYFFCRLIAPRSSFAMDMNEGERAVMQAHAKYWHGLLQAGSVLAFGPVGDPKGPWGLGIVRAADEATAHALEAADPAILSGRGFRYELLPIIQLVTA
jgi:uncharacterized protein YndB with AHSA1/START domain/uncharacterized protein YciI